ncbi:MAG: urea carboxylase, partial [Alcanivoracaceae bacterium]
QVEHGVTEEVFSVDLVEWMVALAAGQAPDIDRARQQLRASGHAIQVRLYAEDPFRNFQPCPGLLTEVNFPAGDGIRIDSWVEAGIEVPPYFDPMLAKVIVHGSDRKHALEKMAQVLAQTRLYGSETNLSYLRALVADPVLQAGEVTTRYLNDFHWQPSRVDVLQGGTQTTVQDYPARSGYWHVGVPPSGPFDSCSFRLANRLLENDADCAGLEITMQGPVLQFSTDTQIVVAGADCPVTLDEQPVAQWSVVDVKAGQVLAIGRIAETGARAYLCVRGGIQCPLYLGSRATFTLGQFGGHNGRALRAGDVLHLSAQQNPVPASTLAPEQRPGISGHWHLHVIYGPHGAPDFFTEADVDMFFGTDWEVHYNSSRTGIRLVGPKPEWARKDGGEAGLHPSNIHDNAYAFGTVDFTGDMPVILGPDGPSLGGFVCPATVVQADLWKLGQLRAGDRIRFVPIALEQAVAMEARQRDAIEALQCPQPEAVAVAPQTPVVRTEPASRFGDEICYRVAGDHFLLVEYGEKVLDVRLRFRVHALMRWLEDNRLPGLRELTPGIRSLQLHYDSQTLSLDALLAHLESAEQALAEQLDTLSVPSRIVHLPLSWDDEACHQAIEKYMQSVRRDAPWCPSNLEFIRRINGLEDIQAVKDVLFEASYLVMGLGDVYLGAPVATPVDPRHRLVTTKYNPARTWTAENSVGIGGSYLCVYGMEGPGGYQFVGRTLQMWNRYRQTTEFQQPWLLRFFDQIRFHEVSHEELEQIRRDFPVGRYPLRIEETEFRLADYEQFMTDNAEGIEAFRSHREQAYADELERWHATGQFNFQPQEQESTTTEVSWPEDSTPVDSPVAGSVWQASVAEGETVAIGDTLMVLESMKMEIPVQAPVAGKVIAVLHAEGGRVG